MCVCIALCTIVAHNIAQNGPDNFPPYPKPQSNSNRHQHATHSFVNGSEHRPCNADGANHRSAEAAAFGTSRRRPRGIVSFRLGRRDDVVTARRKTKGVRRTPRQQLAVKRRLLINTLHVDATAVL